MPRKSHPLGPALLGRVPACRLPAGRQGRQEGAPYQRKLPFREASSFSAGSFTRKEKNRSVLLFFFRKSLGPSRARRAQSADLRKARLDLIDIARRDLEFLLLPSIDRYPSLVRPCEPPPLGRGVERLTGKSAGCPAFLLQGRGGQ